MSNKQRGIALVQVLIISGVLMLLGIFIQQTLRQQAQVVAIGNDKVMLRLALEDAQAQVVKALLSHNRYQEPNAQNMVVKSWNFYGQPFMVGDVAVKLQDISGLLNINTGSRVMLTRYFEKHIDKPSLTEHLVDSIADWKDADNLKHLNGAEKADYKNGITPRNDYLQSIDELKTIMEHLKVGFNHTQSLRPLSFAKMSGFNPLSAPVDVLETLLQNEDQVQQVIQARDQGQLTGFHFYQITGIDSDEYVTFGTSQHIGLELSATKNGVRVTKKLNLKVNPRALEKSLTISNIVWY
ncbi:type II secretion system minor pseudopilin [Pseudoalteromonas peptidolytica]|uniref:general secretion pathway protein GspK n=1 Tax=Pseudoalteromonas peptidolytica TaxID=61150 RepID=UPI00298E581A|nr:type II secretion system protein GspK [Pseudoalteromonas peptidolytica]MDW7549406.1 type II secretion system protein GspK [Pseudoalteromonas peptidolytica]